MFTYGCNEVVVFGLAAGLRVLTAQSGAFEPQGLPLVSI